MSAFTIFHTAVSLLAIVSGIVVAYGLLTGQRHERSTLAYLIATIVTLVTGFLFPYHGFIPTVAARYRYHMAGWWRPVFVVGSVVLLYFNCLVLIVQSFQKVPSLNALAPTGAEPIVAICQSVLLLVFLIVGFFSIRRFRPSIAAF
jgi:hypothetical protein